MTGIMFAISLFFFLFSLSSYKCFHVDAYTNNVGKACSTVFCSNTKVSDMYESSKFLLAEMESLLYDLRDEKASQHMEHAFNKQLDFETSFPQFTDYENIAYVNLPQRKNGNYNDYSDFDHEIDFDMSEPVPFINISTSNDIIDEMKNFNDDETNETYDNSLTDEEEIAILLSKIQELEEAEKGKNNQEAKKSKTKRYFR